MTKDVADIFISVVNECANALEENSENSEPLRNLQKTLRTWMEDQEYEEVRGISYILALWIERYYLHLAGRVPPSISQSIADERYQLCRDIIPDLKEIANNYRSDHGALWIALDRLVKKYLNSIDNISKLVE